MMHEDRPDSRVPQAHHAVAFFLLWLMVALLGGGLLTALILQAAGPGIDPDSQLVQIVGNPIMVLLTLGLTSLLLHRGGFDARETLSLHPCRLSVYFWAAVTVIPIGLLVGHLTSYLLQAVPGLISENLLRLVRMSRFSAPEIYVPFALAISIGPGISEELAFRGFLLRGLRTRFRSMWAVTITGGLFALVHLDPLHALMVFPTGIYLGYLVVRTGSLYPAILAHAFNNLWSTLEAGLWQAYAPEIDPAQILLGTGYPPAILGVALVLLIVGLWALRRLATQERVEP